MKWIREHITSLTCILCLLSFYTILPDMAGAALGPEEIAVVVNSRSSDSVRIGKLYLNLRDVPADHLIKVNVTDKEDVSREDYDELIAGPVRRAVSDLYAKGVKIRGIVTTYGVPLRVGPVKPLIEPQAKIDGLGRRLKAKKEIFEALVKKEKESQEPTRELKGKRRKVRKEMQDINSEIAYLRGSDTVAAVDSELAMIFVPDYQLAGWQPNPDYIMNSKNERPYYGRVLMVSRLDGPTPELAAGLVRSAVEVEKTGLTGKIYLDARGLKSKNAYGQFDDDIRRTAQYLSQSSMQVVLDDRPALFGNGSAPSAALYCGWYSLGHYRDAFEWARGAVGYHVASSEAYSLRKPKAKYWVKTMIEKGVAATLGPVMEPYLHAFPLPSLFFPLLMSGKYTLAEVFAMTNPMLSWRMILIGDPLYTPFKNRPAFILKNAPDAPD